MNDRTPTDAMVTPEIIQEVRDPACRHCAWRELQEREPHLADWIKKELMEIAGRLACSGAPSSVVRDVNRDTKDFASSLYRLLCKANLRLWRKDFPEWKPEEE